MRLGRKMRDKSVWIDGRCRPEHVVIVETLLGKTLPTSVRVHHWDRNRRNNEHSNLLVCPSEAYHQLIHRRMRAYEACGNANWERCRYCKQWDDPAKMRVPEGTRAYGKNKPCHTEHCGVVRNGSCPEKAVTQRSKRMAIDAALAKERT